MGGAMIAIDRSSTLWLLAATAGYIIWSIAFVFLYAFQGYACASGLDAMKLFGLNLATAILLFIWIAHLAAGGALFAYARRARSNATSSPNAETERFLANVSCLLAVAGVVSTFYIGAPVIFLDPCG